MNWIDVPEACALQPGQALRVDIKPPVAIFNVDGVLYATEDTCPHAVASLALDGELCGKVIECGLHFARFDVETGKLVGPPSPRGLRTFEVRRVGDRVELAVTDS